MTSAGTTRARTKTNDDEGSALLIVLVLIVIGSLMILPMVNYQVAVLRANSVLSAKTARLEAVKAGLRVALADPALLYRACGNAGWFYSIGLAPVRVSNLDVTTRCYYIDSEAAQSADELRIGLAATQVGYAPPTELKGSSYVPSSSTSTTEWVSATTLESVTGQIWLPNLPVHSLNRRSPVGYEMPSGFPTCTVYFPGTYTDPIVLDGPTYFASGIYYFEDEVRVVGGASVVVGLGGQLGCATDQDSAFYAENAPATHDISGLGGTWVFGDDGRLVVANTGSTSLSMHFNFRYVSPLDVGSDTSAGVSIASVNGDFANDGVTGADLDVAGAIHVPLSQVGSDAPVAATVQQYHPSVLTPEPTKPSAPTSVSAQRYNSAAVVSWAAPFDGGSPITSYTATASTGSTCTTSGATTCAFVGLANGTVVTFTVIAFNAAGASTLSAASAAVTPSSTASSLAVPSQPNPPTAVPSSGTARVSWTAPANGGAPIISYAVSSSPAGGTCVVDATTAVAPTLQCDIAGLDPALPYTFGVTATNAVGNSTPSVASAAVTPATGLGAPPALPPPPAAVAYHPTAALEFDLPSTAAVTVRIPGYVSIPQGRLRVNNSFGLDVRLTGGVLAAQFDVSDGRASGPQSVNIGFVETIVQRKFKIVSTTTAGDERSTAIVQVNQNGAYAVNSWQVQ